MLRVHVLDLESGFSHHEIQNLTLAWKDLVIEMPELFEMYPLLLGFLGLDLKFYLLSTHSRYFYLSLLYFFLYHFNCDVVFAF